MGQDIFSPFPLQPPYFGTLNQFLGVRGAASNICYCNNPTVYTLEMFKEDYPQFFNPDGDPLLPPGMLNMILEMANSSVAQCRFGSKWRWAIGLYVAHYTTLYLRVYAPSSSTPGEAAGSGAVIGIVESAKLGDASVSYDVSAIVSATESWGAWNSTIYGQMLVTEAQFAGIGGMYVI